MAPLLPKNKFYSPLHQIEFMKRSFPQFKARKIQGDQVEFTGSLNVNPRFPTYLVSILYRGHLKPLVKVLSPKLVPKPPHYYKESESLCLYHPDNYNWQAGRILAREIVPWTAAWIYFYEVWLITGVWYGPEAEH